PRRGDDRGRVGGVGGDRKRPASKARIVLLLDRRKRAVQVDDQGFGVFGVEAQRRCHARRHSEPMFAHSSSSVQPGSKVVNLSSCGSLRKFICGGVKAWLRWLAAVVLARFRRWRRRNGVNR